MFDARSAKPKFRQGASQSKCLVNLDDYYLAMTTIGVFEEEAVFVGLDGDDEDEFVQVKIDEATQDIVDDSDDAIFFKNVSSNAVPRHDSAMRVMVYGCIWFALISSCLFLKAAFPGPYDLDLQHESKALAVMVPITPSSTPLKVNKSYTVLDDKSFQNLTSINEKVLLVYASRDEKLLLNKVSSGISSDSQVAIVDCSENSFCRKQMVQALPTLRLMEYGHLLEEAADAKLDSKDLVVRLIERQGHRQLSNQTINGIFTRSRSFAFVKSNASLKPSRFEKSGLLVVDKKNAFASIRSRRFNRTELVSSKTRAALEPIYSPRRTSMGSSTVGAAGLQQQQQQPPRRRRMESQMLAVMKPTISFKAPKLSKAIMSKPDALAQSVSSDERTGLLQIPRAMKPDIPVAISSASIQTLVIEPAKSLIAAQPDLTPVMSRKPKHKRKQKKRRKRERKSGKVETQPSSDDDGQNEQTGHIDSIQYLTRSTFESVINGDQPVFVNFFIHWCKWCSFHPIPTWKKLGEHVAQSSMPVVIAAVDCLDFENVKFCLEQGVSDLATLRWYDRGTVVDYDKSKEGRSENELFTFIKRKFVADGRSESHNSMILSTMGMNNPTTTSSSTLSASNTLPPQQWIQMYRELEAFHQQYGTTNVPTCCSSIKKQQRKNPAITNPDTEDATIFSPKLINWVKTQRQLLAHADSSNVKRAWLDRLGFEWRLQNKRRTNDEALEEACNSNGNRAPMSAWMIKYLRLVDFQKQFGHTRVPQRYKIDRSLGEWVQRQRYLQSTGGLPKGRKDLLDKLGFTWNAITDQLKCRKDKWMEHYQEFCLYVEKGDLDAPPNEELRRWVCEQRRAYLRNALKGQQKELLDKVEFMTVIGVSKQVQQLDTATASQVSESSDDDSQVEQPLQRGPKKQQDGVMTDATKNDKENVPAPLKLNQLLSGKQGTPNKSSRTFGKSVSSTAPEKGLCVLSYVCALEASHLPKALG
ncbi:hypothetical protein MPSEU_000846200 [Mayamaea pseudoterrestris]|nr:hypothetical protein MPSEU_000846200 [Mayamaea pseudoterrestris]